MFLKKKYFQPQLTALDNEIGAIDREIKHLEKILRKEERISGFRREVDKNTEKARIKEDDSRRLANYLSTGSFHTISPHKFRSDLVRRQRLMLVGAIILLVAVVLIIWHFLG